jgi:CBS domain containing-hemolysin-like protein
VKRKHLFLWICIALFAAPAHASFFTGDTLDSVADVMAWVVLVIAPIAAIGVFLMVHILPEKIAEKRKHPQLSAIKTLCILSLFFGGMLWPLAWLWAYTKPALHKLAYGTDVAELEAEEPKAIEVKPELLESHHVAELEQRIQQLQQQLVAAESHNGAGKFSRWLHRFQRHEHGEEV